MVEIEQRLIRLEARVDKLEDELNKQSLGFAVTEVYVKEVYKKMDELKEAVNELKKSQGSEWKGFLDKSFWLVAGAAVMFIAKQIHF